MRLLVVEDEPRLVDQMAAAFGREGYEVTTCGSGEDGLSHALTGGFGVLVLDVNLPGRDGWSVLAELRGRGVATPTLLLTGQGQVDDRVRGFELGADDYLPKPFDFRELLARVRAVARRAEPPNRLAAGELALDTDTRRATRGGRPLDLSPHEFLALLLLVRRNGAVVTRQELSEQVLQRKRLGTSNAVEVLIRRLRLKVDGGFAAELIDTVRGQGYRLLTPAAEPPPAAPD